MIFAQVTDYPALAAILTVAAAISGYFIIQIKYYRDVIKEKDAYLNARNEKLAELYTKTERCMTEVTITMTQLSKDTEKSDDSMSEGMARVLKEISEIKQAVMALQK